MQRRWSDRSVEQAGSDLHDGARVLAGSGLVDAFGHISVRLCSTRALITPPTPLARTDTVTEGVELPLTADALPSNAPREAWIHLETYRARDDVGAVCRAQPKTVAAATAAGIRIRPLHGQGALLGPEVPLFENPRLVRSRHLAVEVVDRLGSCSAVILRGNGAVTVGSDVGEAVSRMWLLDASAALNLAAATGSPHVLSAAEQEAWRSVGAELLERIWTYLKHPGSQE